MAGPICVKANYMPSTAIQTELRLKTVLPLAEVPNLRSWLQDNYGHSSTSWKIETHNGSLFNWRGIAGAVKSNRIEASLPVTVVVTVFSVVHMMLFLQHWKGELLLN